MEANNIQEVLATEVVENKEEVVEVEVVTPPKKYTFRKLTAGDIGLMTSVIKKIGVNKIAGKFKTDDLVKLMSDNKDDSMTAIGISLAMELVQIIIESYEYCENDLHKLLSKTSNLSEEEVKGLGFDEFFDMLFDFFKKDEFMGFLNRVLKSLGMAE